MKRFSYNFSDLDFVLESSTNAPALPSSLDASLLPARKDLTKTSARAAGPISGDSLDDGFSRPAPGEDVSEEWLGREEEGAGDMMVADEGEGDKGNDYDEDDVEFDESDKVQFLT